MTVATNQKWCGCSAKFHFAYSILGILIGLSAAPIFAARFYNYSSASFALISAAFAFWLSLVHFWWLKKRWNIEHLRKLTMYMYAGKKICYIDKAIA